jgi:putative aminopeptidase FrvX
MDSSLKMLKELTNAFGPSGFEDDVYKIMKDHVGAFTEVSSDNLGSFIAKLKGSSDKPKIMIAGHMDEVGFIVRDIAKDGFVKITPVGGWWPNVMLSQKVTIRTSKGEFTGVIGSKPPHLLEQNEREKAIDLKNIFVDFGVDSSFKVQEELGIRRGDPIVPKTEFEILGNKNLLLAKAWDNRIGCALVIDVLKQMKDKKHNNTIYGVGTVMEEVGLRGAQTSAAYVEPDVAFAVDVSLTQDSPGSEGGADAVEKLGAGVALLFQDASMITNPRLLQYCVDIAEKNNIKYHVSSLQRGAYDTGKIHMHGSGVPSIPIGVPSRYVHSHTSIISYVDYKETLKLLIAICEDLDQTKVKSFIKRG